MRPLTFRNSSKAIAALLSPRDTPPHEEASSFYDEELQFSTFRSEDYRFYQCFHGREVRSGDSSLQDSSLEMMGESESEEQPQFEKKQLSSIGSTNESATTFRQITFRNNSQLIRRILNREEKGLAMKNLNFRNRSVLLRGILQLREKEI